MIYLSCAFTLHKGRESRKFLIKAAIVSSSFVEISFSTVLELGALDNQWAWTVAEGVIAGSALCLEVAACVEVSEKFLIVWGEGIVDFRPVALSYSDTGKKASYKMQSPEEKGDGE